MYTISLSLDRILDYLDGRGLIITDEYLIEEALAELGFSIESKAYERED